MLDLDLPESFNRPVSWDLALVAEADGWIIGSARLRALDDDVPCPDQVPVASACAHSGIARELPARLADAARARGSCGVTGTTFRDIAFSRWFSEQIGAVVDVDPRPATVHHRDVEDQAGLDRLGERVVMRLDLARRADDGAHRDARGWPEPRGPWWDLAGSGVSSCAATRRGAAARISKLSGIDSTLGLLT